MSLQKPLASPSPLRAPSLLTAPTSSCDGPRRPFSATQTCRSAAHRPTQLRSSSSPASTASPTPPSVSRSPSPATSNATSSCVAVTSSLTGRPKLPGPEPHSYSAPLLLPSEHGLPFSLTLQVVHTAPCACLHPHAPPCTAHIHTPTPHYTPFQTPLHLSPHSTHLPAHPEGIDLHYVLCGEGSLLALDGSKREVRAGDSFLALAHTTHITASSHLPDQGSHLQPGPSEPLATLKFHIPPHLLQFPPHTSPARPRGSTSPRDQTPTTASPLQYDTAAGVSGTGGVLSAQECEVIMSTAQVRAKKAAARISNSGVVLGRKKTRASSSSSSDHQSVPQGAPASHSASGPPAWMPASPLHYLLGGSAHAPLGAAAAAAAGAAASAASGALSLGSAAAWQLWHSVTATAAATATVGLQGWGPGVAGEGLHGSVPAAAAAWSPSWLLPQGLRPASQGHVQQPMHRPCVLMQRALEEFIVYRFPHQTNQLAFVFDPSELDLPLSFGVEVFEPQHHTPIHVHNSAHELFFVLAGEGDAYCDGHHLRVQAGDIIVFPPGCKHGLDNNSRDKLYCLQLMAPNEQFVEMVKTGTHLGRLDDEDLCNLTNTHC